MVDGNATYVNYMWAVSKSPLPRRFMVFIESVLSHRKATKAPYWDASTIGSGIAIGCITIGTFTTHN
jgi:hypothetical protein